MSNRWVFTNFKNCCGKFVKKVKVRQNIYVHVWQRINAHYDEEIMKIQWGEKRGEKRGEISPLHLNIIFGSFTLITMKSWQNIYEEVMTKHLRLCLTKHLRWSHDKTYTFMFDKVFTKKSWQNIYEEVLTKHLRRSLDKTCTMKSWKFMRWEKRWENGWDLTSSPKIYFYWIQHKNHEFP